jgi:hypothetical protein
MTDTIDLTTRHRCAALGLLIVAMATLPAIAPATAAPAGLGLESTAANSGPGLETAVTPEPGLEATAPANATVSATGGSTAPGGTVTLSYTVENTGSSPAGILLDVTDLPDDASTVEHVDDEGTFNANETKWVFPTIEAGQSKSVSITIRVPNDSEGAYETAAEVRSVAGVQATTTATVTVAATEETENSSDGGGIGGAGPLPPPSTSQPDDSPPDAADGDLPATDESPADTGTESGRNTDTSTGNRTIVYGNGSEGTTSGDRSATGDGSASSQSAAGRSPGFGIPLALGAVLCAAWLRRRIGQH